VHKFLHDLAFDVKQHVLKKVEKEKEKSPKKKKKKKEMNVGKRMKSTGLGCYGCWRVTGESFSWSLP
jgi:predicted Fe-S protein YdhL (DUF1289 family)